MKTQALVTKKSPDKPVFARFQPKKENSILTQAIELRCSQCGTLKTAYFGSLWNSPSEGVITKCKGDSCLTETVHHFVRIVLPKK